MWWLWRLTPFLGFLRKVGISVRVQTSIWLSNLISYKFLECVAFTLFLEIYQLFYCWKQNISLLSFQEFSYMHAKCFLSISYNPSALFFGRHTGMLSRVAHENGRKKCCSQLSGNSEAAVALELTPLVRQGGVYVFEPQCDLEWSHFLRIPYGVT